MNSVVVVVALALGAGAEEELSAAVAAVEEERVQEEGLLAFVQNLPFVLFEVALSFLPLAAMHEDQMTKTAR